MARRKPSRLWKPRATQDTEEYGAAVRGDRPARVPDGLEIKTLPKTKVRVDCHNPHPGLHLVVLHNAKKADNAPKKVLDILIAFLFVKAITARRIGTPPRQRLNTRSATTDSSVC
jgi:hypothetical protein